jgi:hypothetical protein
VRPPKRDDTIAIPMRTIRRAIVVVGGLVLLAVATWLVLLVRERLSSGEDRRVDHSTYQAVFLTSSQVYFGKLTIDGDDYLLRDVFYLNSPADSSSRGQLVKRGNELHGPVEPMIIPARSVLFFENMRDDSEVLAAIRLFKSGQAPSATVAPTTAPTTAPTQAPATPSRSPSPSPTR